jgi:hypothetical protein
MDMMTMKTTSPEEMDSALDREVGAALIASGIGSLVLGLTVVGAEASESIRDALIWSDSVGPLSGKTGVAVIAFVLSWLGLHYALKNARLPLMTSFIITLLLVGLGLLLTFPPIFELFAPE